MIVGKVTSMSNLQRSSYHHVQRMMSSFGCAKSLLYKEYGEPTDVIQIASEEIKAPQENEVSNFSFMCFFWFDD